jgi:hypothetical protein
VKDLLVRIIPTWLWILIDEWPAWLCFAGLVAFIAAVAKLSPMKIGI